MILLDPSWLIQADATDHLGKRNQKDPVWVFCSWFCFVLFFLGTTSACESCHSCRLTLQVALWCKHCKSGKQQEAAAKNSCKYFLISSSINGQKSILPSSVLFLSILKHLLYQVFFPNSTATAWDVEPRFNLRTNIWLIV